MGCVLVDDDKSICSLLNAFFTKIAYQVEVPHDAEARIKCFDNGPVFDLGMKKNVQFLVVRQDKCTENLPVARSGGTRHR